MKKCLTLALVVASVCAVPATAQRAHHPNFLKERFQPGRRLVGASLTGLGLAAKAGFFLREGLWTGLTANGQLRGVFAEYVHFGPAARYYVARGRDFSFFAEGGYAYGYFNMNRWELLSETPTRSVGPNQFYSGNLHFDLGADLWLNENVSLEAAIRRNQLLYTGDVLPGASLGVNYFF
jgi:hypothetical protein